jgi:Flp pilus assembly protein TadD
MSSFVSAAFLSFALSTAAGPPPPTTAELVQLGEGLAQRGDGKRAVAHLDKALAAPDLTPELRARAELAYGLALLQAKKPKDAAVHLRAAASAQPLLERAWLLLGVAHDNAEEFPEAIAAYREGVKNVPKSPVLRHELGMALLQAGQNGDGARVLVDATRLAEQDPELRTDTAYGLVLTGAFAEAKEHATLAVSLAPASPDAYFNLGLAEAGLGNTKAARTALTRAIEIDDIHVPSLIELALLEQRAGDDASAVRRLTRALQVEPDNGRAQAALGVSLGRLGTDDQRAKALLLGVVHADPKMVQAHALLGDIAEREGKLDEALKRYDQVKRLRPDDAAVKARIDELKAKKRAPKKAP